MVSRLCGLSGARKLPSGAKERDEIYTLGRATNPDRAATAWTSVFDIVRQQSIRRQFSRLAAVVLIAGSPLGSPPVFAHADVTQLAPQSSRRDTVDGWKLSVSLAGESINSVPNLAGAPNSREAFVTLSASADIGGSGANPITSANFVAGYQVGCQVDVSQGLQIGGTGQLAGSLGASLAAAPGVSVGGTGSLGGYMQTNLQPGVITTLPMGNMPVVAHVGHLDMQDVHIKVDACGGPVTIRSYATLAAASDVQQTQVSTYGDPYVLN